MNRSDRIEWFVLKFLSLVCFAALVLANLGFYESTWEGRTALLALMFAADARAELVKLIREARQ